MVRRAVRGSDAKEWAKHEVVGLWAAPMLPLHSDRDEIDYSGMRKLVTSLLQLDLGGLAFSSLMEPWSSTREERMSVLDCFMDEAGGHLPVYVNITDHSIKETVALGEHALEAGAAVLLLQCPYEHAKTPSAVTRFVEYVAERLDAPLALYNTTHAGYIMPPEQIADLAQLENVCAIKNVVDDLSHTDRLFDLCEADIVISNPVEAHYLRNIVSHGQQVLFSTTATHLMQFPEYQPIAQYSAAARSGDLERANRISTGLAPLRDMWNRLYSELWSLEHAVHPIPSLKVWQSAMGYPSGPPRPPLVELSESERVRLLKEIESTGLMHLNSNGCLEPAAPRSDL